MLIKVWQTYVVTLIKDDTDDLETSEDFDNYVANLLSGNKDAWKKEYYETTDVEFWENDRIVYSWD